MKEITYRLQTILKNKYPQILDTLNPAATKDEIQKLETTIGLALPNDFVDFYSVFNGQKLTHLSLFDGDALMSIEDIIVTYNQWKEFTPSIEKLVLQQLGIPIKSEPERGIKDDWWNDAWIPITSNGCGDNYCIDLNPTLEGQSGQIIRMWHDDSIRELIAKSFKEWLSEYIEDLENNKYEFSDSIGWGGLMKVDKNN